MLKFCADCGKPIDEHKGWFWRRYYQGYEFYCYKCGRSHIGGPGTSYRLVPETFWNGEKEAAYEQQAKGSERREGTR